MTVNQPSTNELIRAAASGDQTAGSILLSRHRARLRRMVASYFDHRLAARVDPSDVVQEALTAAARNLQKYVPEQPLPFYPWLRQFAWQGLLHLRRTHIEARRRSFDREEPRNIPLAEGSALLLADQLIAGDTSPSRRMIRDELHRHVREALDRLPPRDREVLLMRHLEEMKAVEIGAVLGISKGAVRLRHLRALTRLRAILGQGDEEALS